jgi:hypothetical protein
MDPRWRIKLNEWSQENIGALAFFEELRIRFTMEELLHQYPILLEHYLRGDIRHRLATCTLRTTKASFHIQTIVNYLEDSPEGMFTIERHFPPDMGDDRAVLIEAYETVLEQEQNPGA